MRHSFGNTPPVSISPELLAALAQVESAGNPIARTYWRWRLTSDPFAVYQPASSAVGMYQMTDAAFAEAQGYCILHHTVVESRLFRNRVLFSGRAAPRHRTYGGVLGPEGHGDSRSPPKDEDQPSAKGGAGCGDTSVRHRSGEGIRGPRLPSYARGALWRSRCRSISRPNHRHETKIPEPG